MSAKHALVSPDEVLEPYDLTLNSMPIEERPQWAHGVLGAMAEEVSSDGRSAAGVRYREWLEHALRDQGVQVHAPMEGLRIGEQLADGETAK